MKTSNKLLLRFAVIFFIFGLLLTGLCGVIAYTNENQTFTNLQLELAKKTGAYIQTLIYRDGKDFKRYAEYFKANHEAMHVPIDFDNYNDAYDEFKKAFASEYPGKVFGIDVSVEELSDELKEKYFVYDQEYWLLTFEDARKTYGFEYVYFMQMNPENEFVTYMLDIERIPRDDDERFIYLGDSIVNPYEKFPVEWDVYNSGQVVDEFQIWDNEYGHTYAYYTPIVVEGEALGVVGVELQIDTINRQILMNTLKMTFGILAVMIAAIAVMLYFINYRYLKKLVSLTDKVRAFSESKDPALAEDIRGIADDGTEISELSDQTAKMIVELDGHMKKLVETAKELTVSQMKAAEASELASKDSLTGIRNKMSYDKMCKDINFRIEGGFTEFGIAMIDLNFLKRINDTYGHDKGNIAIIRLCELVCRTFKHSPVFRIGGDEFVVILKGEDFRDEKLLVQSFAEELEQIEKDDSLENWERISAAVGIAMFDGSMDRTIENTFKRADERMYENKRAMKAVREV